MTTRFLVIGGGIVGASISYHLAVEGAEVLLLERRGIGAEASGASAGGVRQQRRHMLEIGLAVASVQRWPDLDRELGTSLDYQRCGGLQLAVDETDEKRLRRTIEHDRAAGLQDVYWVDEQRCRELVPHLGPDVRGGSYCPTDGRVDPVAATRAFATAAYRLGARVMVGRQVVRLIFREDRVCGVVDAKGEELGADLVINAAGAWGPTLHRQLHHALPVEMRIPQMMATLPARGRLLEQVVGLRRRGDERGISLKQLPSGSFMIGGGWGAAKDAAGRPTVDPENARRAIDLAADVIPAIRDLPVERFWFGKEAQTVDALPVVGAVPDVAGYLTAFGFSGHGLAIAPAIGAAVADLAVGRVPRHSVRGLAPRRFLGVGLETVPNEAPSAG